MVQRVLVTAGAGGIGLAVARAFAADGARVHIADIDEAAVTAATDPAAAITGSVADISRPEAVQALFDSVQHHLGGLDVLVNNAGITGPSAPVDELDPAAWTAVLDLNLSGTFLVTRAAVPLLKRSARASIIVMSSLAGRFGHPNRIAYATTKWGLVGFTKTLAMELGPFGITANTIHPGSVSGPRLTRTLESRAAASGRTVEEEFDLAVRGQSVKRFTDPADIAELARFLAGKHARTISGQMFPIDGDARPAIP